MTLWEWMRFHVEYAECMSRVMSLNPANTTALRLVEAAACRR